MKRKVELERANVSVLPCPVLFPVFEGNKIGLNQRLSG